MSNLWRIFIPTWRLFNRPGPQLKMRVKIGSEWQPYLQQPKTPWWGLFFNPAGNLYHARMNLLQRFVDEAAHADDLTALVSYQLLADLAEGREFQVVVE